jgi:hypothetical protein
MIRSLLRRLVLFRHARAIANTSSDDFRLSNVHMWTEAHHNKDGGGSFQRMRLQDGNIVFVSVGVGTVKVFVMPLEATDPTQFTELKEFALAHGWSRFELPSKRRFAEDLLILNHLRSAIAWPASVDELSATLRGMDDTLEVNALVMTSDEELAHAEVEQVLRNLERANPANSGGKVQS